MRHQDEAPGPRLQRYVVDALASASAGLSLRGRGSRTGVHRTRKSIRRARAALLLGWRERHASVELARAELKRLNDALSELRDTHVLVGVVERLLDAARDEDRRALRDARKALSSRRRAQERSPEMHALLVDVASQLAFLRSGMDALPWNAVDAVSIAARLEATQTQIARTCGKAVPNGKPAAWHTWRRRLRRLSQQRRACASIGFDTVEDPFARSLAEQLGVLQDLNMFLEHSERAHAEGDSDAPSRHVVLRASKHARDAQQARLLSVLELTRLVSDTASDS